jgi:GH24 family phage-related lysozyme (muramidase)
MPRQSEPGEATSPEISQNELALEYLAAAWAQAEDSGIEAEVFAHAALFAALASLVRSLGEETAGDLIASLPIRIRQGDYSLHRIVQ